MPTKRNKEAQMDEYEKRLLVGDRLGDLTFMGRVAKPGWSANKSALSFYAFDCDCGEQVVWAQPDVSRRRKRWRDQKLHPCCGECVRNGRRVKHAMQQAKRKPIEGLPREDARRKSAEDKARRAHANILSSVYSARTWNSGRGLNRQARLEPYVDALNMCMDRRWETIRQGDITGVPLVRDGNCMRRANPEDRCRPGSIVHDGPAQFAADMALPHEDEGDEYLLRHDPFKPWTRNNCYWGSARERMATRYREDKSIPGLRGVIHTVTDPVDKFIGWAPHSMVAGSKHDPDVPGNTGAFANIMDPIGIKMQGLREAMRRKDRRSQ
jgi:hypothetical protein